MTVVKINAITVAPDSGDEESFQTWLSSRDFHASHGARTGGTTGTDDTGTDDSPVDTPTGDTRAPEQARPVGLGAELWGYEVVDL